MLSKLTLKKRFRSIQKNFSFLQTRFLLLLQALLGRLGFKNVSFFHMSKTRQKEWEEKHKNWVQEYEWHKTKWTNLPALVHKSGSRTSLYDGQKFDPQYIDLLEDGWTHDHCEICWHTIYETDEPEHGFGYKNIEDSWICCKCFEQYTKPQNNP